MALGSLADLCCPDPCLLLVQAEKQARAQAGVQAEKQAIDAGSDTSINVLPKEKTHKQKLTGGKSDQSKQQLC